MMSETTSEMLVDECDALTDSLYGLSYEEYTVRRDQPSHTPLDRRKIRLDMYDRILSDGWSHER